MKWPVGSLTFTLPMLGASAVSFVNKDVEQYHNAGDVHLDLVKGVGARLTIPLPDASQHGFVDGEIRLSWTRDIRKVGSTYAGKPFPIWAATQFVGSPSSSQAETIGTEEILSRQFRNLTTAKRKEIIDHLKQMSPTVATTPANVVIGEAAEVPKMHPGPVPATVMVEPNADQDRRLRARESLIKLKASLGI